MITNFKIYEESEYNGYYDDNDNLITKDVYNNVVRYIKPNVDNYSDDLWKLIDIANWQKVIDNSEIIYEKEYEKEKMLARVFKNFEYIEFKKIGTEYFKLENELLSYFKPVWLKDDGLNLSDDGYYDFISSVIGKGKDFIKKCIKNKKTLINMVKNDDYTENFSYLWSSNNFAEYDKIRTKYDPLYRDLKKYNM